MSIHPYSNEELNFFKFASIVLNEFPNAIRQLFVDLWNKRIAPLPGKISWDDSIAVRNMLLKSEGRPKTKIPINISFQDWDCTALFQATLYAKTFALHLKNRKPVPGPFHSPVASPSGDPNETIAMAIDQLRLLRNTLCHLSSSRVDKVAFDQYVQSTKEAFIALNLSTTTLESIGNQPESDFPISKVQQLDEKIKKERNVFNEFLKSDVACRISDVQEGNRRIEAKLELILQNERSGDRDKLIDGRTNTDAESELDTQQVHVNRAIQELGFSGEAEKQVRNAGQNIKWQQLLVILVLLIIVIFTWVNLSAGPLRETSQPPQTFLTLVEKFHKPMCKAIPSKKGLKLFVNTSMVK